MDFSSGCSIMCDKVLTAVLFCVLLLVRSSDSRCSFPKEYRGGWYENYIGEVNISQHSISTRGDCEQNQGNKFIVKQVQGHGLCYRCLVFTFRPDNILEYKESFCMTEKRSLASICPRIMPNAMLKTLIRNPSKPIPCPFQGNYQFSYTNSTSLCSNPFSTVSACSTESQLEFHFKQCSNNMDSHNIDLELKCIARWKSGGNYLMGKFTDLVSLKEMYRCFMYERIGGNSVLVAMSADATCRGIMDPKDGPVTMALQRDVINYPVGRDQFPPWLWRKERKWHDLSGQFTYHIDKSNTEIRISTRKKHGGRQVKETLRCYMIDHVTSTGRLFQAISMTSRDCVTKFQCIRILRRTDDVVEFHRANWVPHQSDACQEENFRGGIKHLLIPSKIPATRCPYDGRYDVIATDQSECRSKFSSGCDELTQMRVDVNCPAFEGARLKCLSTWTHNATTYIIARRHHGGLQANCFSFTRIGEDSIRFSLDDACNMGAPLLLKEQVKYTLKRPSTTCSGEVVKRGNNKNRVDRNRKQTPVNVPDTTSGSPSVNNANYLITLTLPLLTLIIFTAVKS